MHLFYSIFCLLTLPLLMDNKAFVRERIWIAPQPLFSSHPSPSPRTIKGVVEARLGAAATLPPLFSLPTAPPVVKGWVPQTQSRDAVVVAEPRVDAHVAPAVVG